MRGIDTFHRTSRDAFGSQFYVEKPHYDWIYVIGAVAVFILSLVLVVP